MTTAEAAVIGILAGFTTGIWFAVSWYVLVSSANARDKWRPPTPDIDWTRTREWTL